VDGKASFTDRGRYIITSTSHPRHQTTLEQGDLEPCNHTRPPRFPFGAARFYRSPLSNQEPRFLKFYRFSSIPIPLLHSYPHLPPFILSRLQQLLVAFWSLTYSLILASPRPRPLPLPTRFRPFSSLPSPISGVYLLFSHSRFSYSARNNLWRFALLSVLLSPPRRRWDYVVAALWRHYTYAVPPLYLSWESAVTTLRLCGGDATPTPRLHGDSARAMAERRAVRHVYSLKRGRCNENAAGRRRRGEARYRKCEEGA